MRKSYQFYLAGKNKSIFTSFTSGRVSTSISDAKQRSIPIIATVGNGVGDIYVPGIKGAFWAQRKRPDGDIVCFFFFVPTTSDGIPKDGFNLGDTVLLRPSSDTQPLYWIYAQKVSDNYTSSGGGGGSAGGTGTPWQPPYLSGGGTGGGSGGGSGTGTGNFWPYTMTPPPQPPYPSGFFVSKVSTSIQISWNPVSAAQTYNIYRATSSTGAYTVIATVSSSPYTDSTGLTSGTTYYYKITAIDYGSESGFTPVQSVIF